MKKLFFLYVFPMLAVCIVSFFLYYMGHTYQIEWLNFYYEKDMGSTIEMGGSVIPFMVGLAVGFITEKLFSQHVE